MKFRALRPTRYHVTKCMITHPILWLSARTALWLSNRRAVTSIEYALIAALIAVIIISAITSVGKNISATFNKVASEL